MKVYKLVTKNTIEERICIIREEKRSLFKMTIDDYNGQNLGEVDDNVGLGIEKLKYLLQR